VNNQLQQICISALSINFFTLGNPELLEMHRLQIKNKPNMTLPYLTYLAEAHLPFSLTE